MSQFFPKSPGGNPGPDSRPDARPDSRPDARPDARPAATPSLPGAAPAAPRPPLFPPREEARPLFPRPAAPGAEARPPLFPQRDGKAPLFPPRDPCDEKKPLFPRPEPGLPGAPVAPAAPRAPLFPPRDDKAPLFPRAAEKPFPPREEKAPLFPPRDGKPPLFPRPVAPAAPAPLAGTPAGNGAARPSLFPPREEPKPLFPRPAGSAPLFPAFPAKDAPAAPKPAPIFGATSAPAPALPSHGQRKEAKLSDEEFVLLRDFLYQQAGIFVAENRKYLVENRLAARLRELGLHSFGEYHKYLRFDAHRGDELNKFFECMTTNETSFFRNGPQLDVFRDKVLARVLDELRAKGQKKLRIWSAGCSSGEEPYTLAIILAEALKQDLGSWDIRITANDLSLAMLDSARRGLYNSYAIRTTPPDILARYFTREGDVYRIDPKLQRLISFGQINLNDKAQLQKVERSQIVFCRNVIIYFDDEMKRNVISAFYDNLMPGGYLLIGHSESLHNLSRAFKPEHHAGSIVYCKQS